MQAAEIDLDLQTSPSKGPNVFPVNLAQIHSAVRSWDISYINKKSHRQRQKQNLTQFTVCGNEYVGKFFCKYRIATAESAKLGLCCIYPNTGHRITADILTASKCIERTSDSEWLEYHPQWSCNQDDHCNRE